MIHFNTDLIFQQADVVVRGLRVEFSFSLQVELQSLHVKPKVSGVWITLRRITDETQRQHHGKDRTQEKTGL